MCKCPQIERFHLRGQQQCDFIGMKETVQHPRDWLKTPTLPPSHLVGCQYGCRDVILKTIYTYMQLVMPFREEWKSSPIRVDPQAVVGEVEVWRVFKTELVIVLLRAVWIHIVLLWSGFSEIGEWIKLRIALNH